MTGENVCQSPGGEVGAVVDLTNDSGVEDAVDLTSPVSHCGLHTHSTVCIVMYVCACVFSSRLLCTGSGEL